MSSKSFILSPLVAAAVATSSSVSAEVAGYGPNPSLPAPSQSWIPTVQVAPAKGWTAGQMPKAANGLQVSLYADNLEHPRSLLTLSNGDVLVVEASAPERPKDATGIKGIAMKIMMKRAGSTVPSANRITLLRDSEGDGSPETRSTLVTGLNSPYGLAQLGDTLYVANTDSVVKFPFKPGEKTISAEAHKVADLPGGPINHHWTKNIVASADGKFLYAAVGSNSNIAENGIENEENRAAILKVDASTGVSEVFASGLRNPVGLAWQPETDKLWTTVNERDELGNDLVPDYLTSVAQGGFYGWPYSYFGKNKDPRMEGQQKPDLVERAIVPDYALGAHTASLGMVFQTANSKWSNQFSEGVFIAQHGSWNRNPPVGYKVIFVPFRNGKPNGMPIDVLSGFLDADGNALGRPASVALDKTGALLVADDVGNRIWRVAPSTQTGSAAADPSR